MPAGEQRIVRAIYNTYEELKPPGVETINKQLEIYNTYEELKLSM